MAGEIVDNDDVAGAAQGRDQLLLNIGKEAGPVDGAVKDARRGEAVTSERRQKSHGAPMSVRGIGDEALALRSPTPERRHVGFDPCLIDENETTGVKLGLDALPAPPTAGDRRARPLKGEQCFF